MKNASNGGREGAPATDGQLAAALGAILAPIIKDAVAAALGAENAHEPEHVLLTRDEAARVLRVSSRQFDLLRAGDDPPPEGRVGDSPRFIAAELVEWSRAHARKGKAAE
jgi:hypothetical protein